MALPPNTTKSGPDPVKTTARLAATCGFFYCITIFAAFGISSVPPGALRVLLLNFSVLCVIIGTLELTWRHFLVKTREPRWARMLALNEVGGTLAMFWSLYLLYKVPDDLLLHYCEKSELWTNALPMIRSMSGGVLTNTMITQAVHNAKVMTMYGAGGLLLFFQIWVVLRYLSLGRAIARVSGQAQPASLPPVLP